MAGGFRRDVLPPCKPPPRARGGRNTGKTITATRRSGSANFQIADIAEDSTGAPLVGATIDLFRAGDRSFVATTISDGAGHYSFVVAPSGDSYFVRAYLAGTPNIFGTTDVIIPVPV